MPFQAAIFDLDGVLVESESVYNRLVRGMCPGLGFSLNAAEVAAYVGISARDMWTELKQAHGLAPTVDELVRLEWAAYLHHFCTQPPVPVPGAAELVARLEALGLKLAVGSSSPHELVTLVLGRLGLARHFPITVGGNQGLPPKPAPDIFLAAAARLGVPPGACVVIEDSRSGTLAARAAGMRCIGYANAHSGPQDLAAADAIVASLQAVDAALLLRLAPA